MTGPAQPPVPEGELRVSDQDRDRTLELIGQHAAEGRLTLDEHEERASLVLRARTRADLAAVTRDLPALGQPSPGRPSATAGLAPPRKETRWFVAIMGGSKRRGRFRPASVVNVLAIMGGDEIDLRDAEIDANGLTMNMYAVMGGSTIYVPNTVEVEISGFSFMGGNEDRGVAHQHVVRVQAALPFPHRGRLTCPFRNCRSTLTPSDTDRPRRAPSSRRPCRPVSPGLRCGSSRWSLSLHASASRRVRTTPHLRDGSLQWGRPLAVPIQIQRPRSGFVQADECAMPCELQAQM